MMEEHEQMKQYFNFSNQLLQKQSGDCHVICTCLQANESIDTSELSINLEIEMMDNQSLKLFTCILYHFLCQTVELYCHFVAIATVQYSVWVGGAKQC